MTEQQFAACTAAMAWLDDDCLTLDTETTGLGEDAEIVEITVIDHEGNPLMNTLVKPVCGSIPAEVTNIHGITNEMVADAPPVGRHSRRIYAPYRWPHRGDV